MASGVIPVEYAGETNVGLKRTHNEDNFAIFDEENLYVVADGMGGHASGEVASQMAVESLRDFFRATSEDPDVLAAMTREEFCGRSVQLADKVASF